MPEPSVFVAVIVIECVKIEALYYCHAFCDLPHDKFFFYTRKRNNQLAQCCFTENILLVGCFRRTYSKYLGLASHTVRHRFIKFYYFVHLHFWKTAVLL